MQTLHLIILFVAVVFLFVRKLAAISLSVSVSAAYSPHVEKRKGQS